jgi:protein SCO1/2
MDFTTIDQNGNSFNVDDLYGKWSLIFFGYTHCPDVCPISLTVLEQFYNRVANKDVIQIIFVTVDPDRDTPARLKEYLEFFDPGFVGLGGTIDQITSLTDQIGIAYLYQLPQSDGNYLVDHTSSIFLFDQQAQLVSIFSAPHSVDEIYSRFSDIQNFLSTNK